RQSKKETWGVVSSGTSHTKIKIPRLQKGCEYIFRVRAENKIGIGAPLDSEPTIAKHMFDPPSPPGKPTVYDITENAATVSWTLPKSDGGTPITGYILERREASGKWVRVNKTPILDMKYRVTGLFEGNTYEFRVFAENMVGLSKPSPSSDPIKASRPITPPGPPPDNTKAQGVPPPTAKWATDDVEIKTDGRYKIETDNYSTVLTIKDCVRKDTGEYLLTVSNAAGSKTVALHLTVLDVPGPPTGPINILEVTPEHMVISWRPPKDDGGSPIINYIVEKRQSKKETWGVVSSGTSHTKIKIPRLQKGCEYIFRVRAENKIGIGAPLDSEPTIAKHMFDPPSPPGKPTVYDITENAATVSWTLPKSDGGTPITGYILERREASGKWVRVNKTPILDMKYRIPRLQKGCEYIFRVRAENKIGIGAPLDSEPTIAKHMFDPPSPPGKPTVYDITENAATVSWTLPKSDGGTPITGYILERREASGKWVRVNKTPILDMKYRVTGLFEGNTYEFRVFAENMVGLSKPSPSSDPIKASHTLRLSAVIKGVPFPKVIWKKEDHEVSPKADIEVTGVGSKLEIRNTVHEDGGIYSLTVENPAGSKTVSVKVVVLDKPGPPRNLQISDIRSDSCYLTWKEPEDDGGSVITNYVVERKDVASAQWLAISSSSKKRSHMAKYLIEGTQYLFRVAAENQFGRGPYVETLKPIKAIDPLHPPGPPKNLHHVDVDKTEVSLVWNRPDRDGGAEITGYLVEYQEDGADEWTKFQTVPM
ncbi:TITIN protein, partial [Alcedo cyanopectus]|nr:TITIN protein [Ceyx cyanopectus]